jgi:two-component system chemotaxis response regulator CheY
VLSIRNSAINIGGLSFLIADPNPHSGSVIHSILRGFGATRIVDVRTIRDTIQVLIDQKIDMLLLDPQLEKGRGLDFVRSIRRDPNNPCRTMPILIVTGDTRTSAVKAARDCGANLVIAKPVSPAALYERLAWVAFNPRNFAEAADYFGPDRRFKIEGLPDGSGRRSDDSAAPMADAEGPAMSQNEIDNLLQEAQGGGS